MSSLSTNELLQKIKSLEEKVHHYESLLKSFSINTNENDDFLYKDLFDLILFTENSKSTILEKEITSSPNYANFKQILNKWILTILDATPIHITIIDQFGLITLYNQQTALDFKINKTEFIGKHISDLLQIDNSQIELLKTLETGKEVHNKEIHDVNYGIINTRILRNSKGEIIRVVGLFQFLNDARNAEKLVMTGRIAAGIAHEIRNPLTTVRGYLQFLQDNVSNEMKQLFHNLLIPELDRANGIITDFLSITKNAPYKPEPLNINLFFKQYLSQLFNSTAILRNIQISYDLSPKLDDLIVYIDKKQLVQVFLNLFQNSVESTSKDSLCITLSSQLVDNEIIIFFKDNGEGIPHSILPFVFDPFFSTKDEGTGLGLPLTRKLIQNHKGTIQVESDSSGTTFTVRLPVLTNVYNL
ncbi:GHKL domain-containing protein [Bacillus sp. RG28]|uniref:histidine kinase n=1 Tax=Gottfriedia endophytica TaxID=2820819 RepID=A0A940SJY4_9BACI|nr:ATP-binding protein [Gottfriedia endophytica]MBP0724698.1 GHKL domain-containing protein [Gottfriedia endophytica]